MSQFCTRHDSVHNCGMIWLLFFKEQLHGALQDVDYKLINPLWIGSLGAVSIRKTVLPGMAIPMLKIRRPNGRLIFNMEIAIRR